jgi:hypothetical protein
MINTMPTKKESTEYVLVFYDLYIYIITVVIIIYYTAAWRRYYLMWND